MSFVEMTIDGPLGSQNGVPAITSVLKGDRQRDGQTRWLNHLDVHGIASQDAGLHGVVATCAVGEPTADITVFKVFKVRYSKL